MTASAPLLTDAGTAAFAAGSAAYPKPRDAAEAAQQFESLLIAQMLRSAHESDSETGFDSDSDPTGDTMWDVAAQQFAQALARNGGLGMARLITQGLNRGATQVQSATR